MIATAELALNLRSGHPWSLHTFDCVTSTMTEVRQLADAGATSFTVALADAQTAGTGRHDRAWSSDAGDGLWMTALIRPDLSPDQAPWYTLGAAVVVAECLDKLGFPVGIKWPNDVLVSEGPYFRKKLCGIRAEMEVAEDGTLSWVSVGIGLNVHQSRFEGALEPIAASLAMLKEAVPSRAQCAGAILDGLESLTKTFETEGFEPVGRRWTARALGLGDVATVRDLEGEQTGIVRGLDEMGHLLLERPGERDWYTVMAGDLVFERSANMAASCR